MSKREDLEALVWVDGMAERHGGAFALAVAAEDRARRSCWPRDQACGSRHRPRPPRGAAWAGEAMRMHRPSASDVGRARRCRPAERDPGIHVRHMGSPWFWVRARARGRAATRRWMGAR